MTWMFQGKNPRQIPSDLCSPNETSTSAAQLISVFLRSLIIVKKVPLKAPMAWPTQELHWVGCRSGFQEVFERLLGPFIELWEAQTATPDVLRGQSLCT